MLLRRPSTLPLLLLTTIATFAWTSTAGALPVLVKDIDTTLVREPFSVSETDFLDGALLFTLLGRDGRDDVWRTDGTPEGTFALTAGQPIERPANLTVVNGVLFFIAFEPEGGTVLWKSDGTPEGTARLVTLNPAPYESWFSYPIISNGVLFIAANQLLWRSDGTPEGTFAVADLRYAPEEDGRSLDAATVDGTLYFESGGADGSLELWRTDGTVAGTGRVSVIVPGPEGSSDGLHDLTPVGSRLFLAACARYRPCTLWVSDGTEAGTARVAEFNPDDEHNDFWDGPNLGTAHGIVYFFAVTADTDGRRELWQSDGTAAGTRRAEVNDPDAFRGHPVGLNGSFFSVRPQPETGMELWKSEVDGRHAELVIDLLPGPLSSWPTALTIVGDRLFFYALGALWKTDGTAAGTERFLDLDAGARVLGNASSAPADFTVAGDTLFFVASEASSGRELWRTDGTTAGTLRVADINPGVESSAPKALTELNGVLYFIASEPAGGEELWRSDGTEAGTARVIDLTPGPGDGNIRELVVANGLLFFTVGDWNHLALWRSDGTAGGTARIDGVHPLLLIDDHPVSLGVLDGKVAFLTVDEGGRTSLWTSDGTSARTVRVKELEVLMAYPFWRSFTRVDGSLYFWTVGYGYATREVWKTDGTADGTTRIARPPSDATGMAYVDRTVFFLQGGWLSRIEGDWPKVITRLPSVSWTADLTTLNGLLLFHDARAIWRSDGTAAGTQRVWDFGASREGSTVGRFQVVGGAIFFIAPGPAGPGALWMTDGTTDGTRLVTERRACAVGAIMPLGEQLLLSLDEPARGCELWAGPLCGDGGCASPPPAAPGGGGSAPSDRESCDDGDPCTTDRRVTDGCHHEALDQGPAGARCALVGLGSPSAACAGQHVPRLITRRLERARYLLEQASEGTQPRKVRKAMRALRRARRLLGGGAGSSLSLDCRHSLRRGSRRATERAARWLSEQSSLKVIGVPRTGSA